MPKRIVPLTDVQVKNAKPREKEFTVFDGGGLYVLVTPSGGKLWHLKYSYNGKNKRITLGAYPSITLSDARQRRSEVKKMLANGVDPDEVKKAQKAAQGEQDSNTFEVVAREWHSKFAHTWVASHAQHKLERLEKNVFPWIGKRPIKELTAPEVLAVLRRMESRNILDTAHRVRFECSSIFVMLLRLAAQTVTRLQT